MKHPGQIRSPWGLREKVMQGEGRLVAPRRSECCVDGSCGGGNARGQLTTRGSSSWHSFTSKFRSGLLVASAQVTCSSRLICPTSESSPTALNFMHTTPTFTHKGDVSHRPEQTCPSSLAREDRVAAPNSHNALISVAMNALFAVEVTSVRRERLSNAR